MSLPAFGVRVGKHRKTFTVMVGRDRKRRTIGIYPDINLQEARAKAKRIDALLLNSVSGVVDEGNIGRLHFRVECRVEFVEIAAPSAPVRRVGDARRQEIHARRRVDHRARLFRNRLRSV